jgi:chorismate mutase
MELTSIRTKIDRLNEQIVGRLKERSYFPLNKVVYQPDAIAIQGTQGVSFLDFALAGLETYHASLGRYGYPDQAPLHRDANTATPVQRVYSLPLLPAVGLPQYDRLLRFYIDLVPHLAAPGDDPQSYGETAYCDADIVVRLHERVNIGRLVAHVKAASDPVILTLVDQPDDLRAKLGDRRREESVIAAATRTAVKYDLDPDLIARVFRWLIDETLAVEVRFLQQLRLDPKGF